METYFGFGGGEEDGGGREKRREGWDRDLIKGVINVLEGEGGRGHNVGGRASLEILTTYGAASSLSYILQIERKRR